MPPPLMPTCDPAAFPPGLHTGFFAVEANHDDPLAWLPSRWPAAGIHRMPLDVEQGRLEQPARRASWCRAPTRRSTISISPRSWPPGPPPICTGRYMTWCPPMRDRAPLTTCSKPTGVKPAGKEESRRLGGRWHAPPGVFPMRRGRVRRPRRGFGPFASVREMGDGCGHRGSEDPVRGASYQHVLRLGQAPWRVLGKCALPEASRIGKTLLPRVDSNQQHSG